MDEDDQLMEILASSGFAIIPLQAIIDALAEAEQYIKDETGLNDDELEEYLDRIEGLVGKQEALNLDLEEVINWIKAFQGH